MRVPAPPIVTCGQWKARKPKANPVVVGRPRLIVEHHTDGNAMHPGTHSVSPLGLAIAYARLIQNYHMDTNGWNDSGHSFLVTRAGIIVQGRWGTVTAIEHGRMVLSAHCPGQNDNPGIEHEHLPGQFFTAAQLSATVWLQAWICDRTGIRPTALFPHKQFYNTACPDNLTVDIPALRLQVAHKLYSYKANKPVRSLTVTAKRAVKHELQS